MNVGDVVISTEVRHHDVDVTVFGYEYGQIPQLPPAFEADVSLVKTAMDAAKEIEGIKVTEGLIATGDSFMNDPERVEFAKKQFPGLQAFEMEGAAIAQYVTDSGLLLSLSGLCPILPVKSPVYLLNNI